MDGGGSATGKGRGGWLAAQQLDDARQVGGQGGDDLDWAGVGGVAEAQALGVQGHAIEDDLVGGRPGNARIRSPRRRRSAPP